MARKRQNPFEIEHPDLIKLDNHDAFNSSVAETIQTIEQKGKEQYDLYVSEVLQTGTKSINDPIKHNDYHLLSTPLKKVQTNTGEKLKELKSNAETFGQLIAIMQMREIDLDTLFSHEFHSFPPALSNSGEINFPSTKANLMHEILTKCYDSPSEEFDARIIDGPFFVHFFGSFAYQTFQQHMAEMHRTLRFYYRTHQELI